MTRSCDSGWIDYQRRAERGHYLRPAVVLNIVAGAAGIGLGGAVAAVGVVEGHDVLLVLFGFRFGEERLACRLRRALQWRDGDVGPEALRIGLAVRRKRRSPFLAGYRARATLARTAKTGIG